MDLYLYYELIQVKIKFNYLFDLYFRHFQRLQKHKHASECETADKISKQK